MPAANIRKNKVELRDPDSPWSKSVLEAAECLAGKPLKVEERDERRYFEAPNPQLASLCRRWLDSPALPTPPRPGQINTTRSKPSAVPI